MDNFDGIVSLLIACLELLLLINIFIFSKRTKLDYFAIIIIFQLFAYQFLEFSICNLGFKTSNVIYSAFVIITFLPPMGFLLILRFWNFNDKKFLTIFLPALFFTFYYLITSQEFTVARCTVFYAAYSYPLGFWYGLFYYLPILISVLILILIPKKNANKLKLKLNRILIFGFSSFALPMMIAFIIYPHVVEIVESLMCKFAFLMALSLGYFSLKLKQFNRTVSQ